MHNRFAIIATFFLFSLQVGAQDIFSPLSTQGVGQLRNKSFIHNLSMGGIGTAYTHSDSMAYSLKNPATSSYLKYTCFDFGVKLGANQVIGLEESNRGTFNDFGLNYMSMAVVLNKKKGWTASFGLAPYSAFGYRSATASNDSNKIEEHFFEGGLSESYFNTAFKLYSNKSKVRQAIEKNEQLRKKNSDTTIAVPKLQNLTMGLQGTYLFGNKFYEHNVLFPNSIDLASINTVNNYLIRGVTYRVGMHYKIKDIPFSTSKKMKSGDTKIVNHKVDFDFGAYFGSSGNNRATLRRHATSFILVGDNVTVPDTVLPLQISTGNFKLPNSFGAGFMFTKKDNWSIGADVDYTQWSTFDYAGLNSTLNDELSFSIGGSYSQPDPDNFFKRLEYRGGFNCRQSFLNQNEKQLNGYSTTFGLGMPFGKTIKSNLNLGFEYGALGNRTDHLFEERYYSFYLGITVNEFWFQQYKEK
jgi:long-subunit fatty acid transport protein